MIMQQHRILIVEDEEIIRLGLQDNFELENYEVETACDGEEAIAKTDSFQPHLILLDVMLPKKSGFEVCRFIRKKHPECIIIMLTAKTEETSKVAGLDMGADDYVTKPFSILELLARVKAFLRRIDLQAQARPTKQLASVDAMILKYFWQRRGEVVLREDLLQDLWGYTPDNMPSTRTIDNHIVNLRRKLEDDQANPKIILSIRGAGYKFDA